MPTVDPLVRFWGAMDRVFPGNHPTRWGCVVTDPRFPEIWDLNYARVESADPGLSLEEVESDTLPQLHAAGAIRLHVVMFRPDGASRLLVELSSRGHRLSWDAVMEQTRPVGPRAPADELTDLDDAFWVRYQASLPAFEPISRRAVRQLVELERTVFLGLGKRWFGVRERDRLVALGSLLVLDRVAYLDHVVTFPEARRRGHASSVTATMARAGRDAGAEHVVLLADREAPGPIALYRSLGFEHVGSIASSHGELRDPDPDQPPSGGGSY